MPVRAKSASITPAQVRWFRFRRSGLGEPFSTPKETARRLIGVQAQLQPAADLAFWNRTARCTVAGLRNARLERRSLVRFWGQRNTLHIYPADDWPFLHAAFDTQRSLAQQRMKEAGLLGDFRRLVRRTERRLAENGPLTYKHIKSQKLDRFPDKWAMSYVVFMALVREGVACHGPDQSGESCFVHRKHWLPKLDWSPPPAEEAFPALVERYLAAYGPAEDRDLAFWYGTTVTNARRWIESAGVRCRAVEVGGRTLWWRRKDLDELAAKPPPASRWPVRLLYRYDPLLLATKDKSWLIDEKHYKKVWRAAAHVEAVLLVGGRIAGTWRYDRKPKDLHVRVSPFVPLKPAVRRAAQKQAAGIAAFYGLELATFEA